MGNKIEPVHSRGATCEQDEQDTKSDAAVALAKLKRKEEVSTG